MSYTFSCKNCLFYTNKKFIYNKHIESKRHNDKIESEIFTHACNICNKVFKSKSGLWKHDKICSLNIIPVNITEVREEIREEIREEVRQEMRLEIEEIRLEREEIRLERKELKEDINDVRTIVSDVRSNQTPTNINNTLNNFNVNLFLNENLKQTKNLMDVVNGIQLAIEYKESISSEDYSNSIAELITNEIDKLPINERPIFCIKNEEESQQIVHVRHNDQWNKETELEWTKQMYNFYIDDDDEPADEDKKIIFYAVKQLEENIIKQIQRVYRNRVNLVATTREYKSEMNHVPNKFRIIKLILGHVNIEREELSKIIETVNI